MYSTFQLKLLFFRELLKIYDAFHKTNITHKKKVLYIFFYIHNCWGELDTEKK